jgi:hypothetical protein
MCVLVSLPAHTMPAPALSANKVDGRKKLVSCQQISCIPKKHTWSAPWCVITHLRMYSFVSGRARCSVICYRQRCPDKFDISFAFIQFEYECRRARFKRIHQIRSQHCMPVRLSITLCVLETCVRPSVCLALHSAAHDSF